MKTLHEIYLKHKKGDWPDKNSVHSYLPVYEEILKPYRFTTKNKLEIGLMSGESLRMWNEYFSGMVYGMDCSIRPIDGLADLTQVISEGYNVKIGDASNQVDVSHHFHDMYFDVIIEDANHDIEQQLAIFRTMKPYLTPNGIYIIEDVQDIDKDRHLFVYLDMDVKIIDRRHIKNRYDDVLVVIKYK